MARPVVAKVEWHPGELYPRVGFVVTNLSRLADRVVVFYNQRGTAEQWIEQGKNAINWTGLSCHSPMPSGYRWTPRPKIWVTSCARWRRPSRSRKS
jgi:hypothetical protein